jgi:two-component system chemotaxis response regulator CheY
MGISVLIVDDSMVARLAIKGIIKDTGASVAEAASGEAALDLVEGGLCPDLVFLDLTMPGMGGIEALKLLKQRRPGIKVAVVTADIQVKTVAEVMSSGAFDVIRKPADKASILDAMARAAEEGAVS